MPAVSGAIPTVEVLLALIMPATGSLFPRVDAPSGVSGARPTGPHSMPAVSGAPPRWRSFCLIFGSQPYIAAFSTPPSHFLLLPSHSSSSSLGPPLPLAPRSATGARPGLFAPRLSRPPGPGHPARFPSSTDTPAHSSPPLFHAHASTQSLFCTRRHHFWGRLPPRPSGPPTHLYVYLLQNDGIARNGNTASTGGTGIRLTS